MMDANEMIRQYLANSPDTALVDSDLLREAAASVRLDKGERGQTFTADDLDAPAGETTGEVPRASEAAFQQAASEVAIQAAIIDALVWDGWLVLRINSGGMDVDGKRYVRFSTWAAMHRQGGDAGIADIIAVKNGECIFIEVKKPGTGRQRKSQVEFMSACEDTGNLYVLASSVDDIAEYLSRVQV